MKPDLLGFDSPLDLLAAALPFAGLLGFALIIAGLVRLRRHHHGTTRPDN